MTANISGKRFMGINSDWSSFLLRAALAGAFLSAVADRFGLWGAYGSPEVAWGNFARFIAYTRILTSAFPSSFTVDFAWISTAAEIILAVLLLIGWKIRTVSVLSGLLLVAFAIGMTVSLGIKAPFDFSVPTAAAAALLLSSRDPDSFTYDAWSNRIRP